MIPLRHRDSGESALADMAPDLTPMLDVLFILLLFFMLTAGAVFQSLKLNLPMGATDDQNAARMSEHILLEIRPDGYALDGREHHGFAALKAALPGVIQDKPGRPVIIAGDKDVAIEPLLKVLTYLRSQNVESANILMRKEPGQ